MLSVRNIGINKKVQYAQYLEMLQNLKSCTIATFCKEFIIETPVNTQIIM
jgi:hypothetical protein